MARVINVDRKAVLGERVAVAGTFFSRLKGLMGRSEWGDIDGLWLEPCSSVHAFGMRFPLDIVLLDGALVVVDVLTLRPWRVSRFHFDTEVVLELPEGVARKTGTRRGDLVAIDEHAVDTHMHD